MAGIDWAWHAKTRRGYSVWRGASEEFPVLWQVTKTGGPPSSSSGGYGHLEALLKLKGDSIASEESRDR